MESSEIDRIRPAERSTAAAIGEFTVKALIAGAVVAVTFWFVADLMIGRIENAIDRRLEQIELRAHALLPREFNSRRFWFVLEREFARLADQDLSPEQKRKILQQTRAIADRWRPFLAELASAIAGEPPTKTEQK